ncbi:MAG TPA: ABC transporter permease [Bryobacteraceae bacterium]
MRTLVQDLKFGVRLLLRAPGFTLVAAAVLALGIGANAAIFSVVDAVLLRPLPFRNPSELMVLWERAPQYPRNRVSPLNYQDWHDRNVAFSSMAALSGGSRALETPSGPEQIPGQAVTREFFDVFGVRPVAGRTFSAEDERTNAAVVLISERLWRTRFGGDPKILGSTLRLDRKPYLVAGVVPASFQIAWDADLWTLYRVNRAPEQRRMHYLQVFGRLKPGVSAEQARASMASVSAAIAEISPETNRGWGITIEPLRDSMVGTELRATSLVLAGVVGFILLLACANVANLMLARGAGRAREMAVRVSLGAGSARLVRQLMTESVLLAGVGGAGGLALAWALIRVAPKLIPEGTLPVGLDAALDARVAVFAACVAMVTGVLFGLAPAWQVARTSLADAMRGGRTVAAGRSRLLGALAVVEIAIAVMVVTGAGLFLRSLGSLSAVDPGFRLDRLLTMQVSLPISRYPSQDRALAFYDSVAREVESLPGVRSASLGGALPLTGWDIGQGFQVVGRPAVEESKTPAAHYEMVGARYFETLAIPIVEGRGFNDRDRAGAPEVAIVNREFARRYLAGMPAVGARVRVQSMQMSGPRYVEREIVGVSGQVKVDGLGEQEKTVEIYVPIAQNTWFWASLSVRTAGDPMALAQAVKSIVAKADPDLPVTRVRTMEQIAYETVDRPRFRARLLAGFAALALALAAVGVFGVLAFSVSQRTREFGIRMALGAQAGSVLRMVLGRGATIAAAGVVLGLGGAAALARLATTLLFGVRPLDPVSFGGAAAVLAAVALAAAAWPAWRAMWVDPAVALRDE